MIADIYKMHINEINIKNKVYNYSFDNLVKAKKVEIENVLIDKKNHKGLTINFPRYVHKKVDKNVKSALPWINGKVWKTWRKKYLMVDDYMLNKALDKIKKVIDIEKFDDTNIFIDKMINCQMIQLLKMLWY